MDITLDRNGRILNRRYRKYLIPAICTAVAISLNEFVDSIVVANLLDSNAMTVVNMGMPIQLIICAIYILFGVGGATLYSEYVGGRQKDKAGKILGLSVGSAVLLAFILTIVGLLFEKQISYMLCSQADILYFLLLYNRIVFLGSPLVIVVLTMAVFFPAAGNPNLATVINITANVVNLIFDYIYIGIFGMGVEGAAWATNTGYLVAFIVLLVAIVTKKTDICFKMPDKDTIRQLKSTMMQGCPTSAGQIGFALQYTVCNNLAGAYGGTVGLTTFSMCIQLISIASIVVQGVMDATSPLVATLKGQRDQKGIEYTIRNALKYQLGLSLIIVLVMMIYPQLLLKMYNVTDTQTADLVVIAVRIFCINIILRGVYILYMVCARIFGREKYSLAISLMDGVFCIIAFAVLFTSLFGVHGLWIAYAMRSFVILLGVFIINNHIKKKFNGKYVGLFLIENYDEDGIKYDVSIDDSNDNISSLSKEIIQFCNENHIDNELSTRAGLIAEEMSLYIRQHRHKQLGVDVLISIYSPMIVMDFRSEGVPFNPLHQQDEDLPENLLILQKIATQIDNDYILGMNSTRIVLSREIVDNNA